MKQKSVIGNPEEKQEYDSFFCSQLVAAAYKQLGFLPQDVSTTQYWPVSFSQDKNLKLTGGANLGVEMLINFNI